MWTTCGQKSENKRKILRKWKDAKVAVIFQNPDKYLAFNRFHWIFFLIVYHEKTSNPLDPNIEEMYLPRESHTVIVDHILADLDKAIENLQTKNNSASMRVHKDVVDRNVWTYTQQAINSTTIARCSKPRTWRPCALRAAYRPEDS